MMKRILAALVLVLTMSFIYPLAQPAYAACPANSSKEKAIVGAGGTASDCNDTGFDNIVSSAVNILSMIVGAAAVIMIIVSGFKYITSGGDSGRVSSAKNTLIYALIGLAVAILAQVMIHFVITVSTKSELPTCTSSQADDPEANNCAKR